MKKKILLTAIASALIVGVTATLGVINMMPERGDAKVSALDKAPEGGDEYDYWLNKWSKPGHVYFHYNRGDKAGYEKFCLWIWNNNTDTDGTLWAFSDPKTQVSDTLKLVPMSDHWMTNQEIGLDGGATMYKDNFGVICDVDINSPALVGGKVKKNKDGSWPANEKASYATCDDLGFLFPQMDSMNGDTHWTSDGGKDNDIDDWRVETNWRDVEGGKALHIFLSTGSLTRWSYFAGSGIPEVKKNPMEEDHEGKYSSKTEKIADNYGVSSTSEAFKKLGVGYQVFVGSFRDSNHDGFGDLRGVIDSLDYFEKLGVNVLWLTPIQKSGAYHGYDIDDYYAVDPKFGTIADYRELIYKAHQKGIKVLMDLVLNHTSKSNVWFTKSQWGVNSGAPGAETDNTGIDWRNVYTWKYKNDMVWQADRTPDGTAIAKPVHYSKIRVEDAAKDRFGPSWYKDGESDYYYYGKFGSSMPEINYENADTRKLVIDMAKYWLSFGLDGFRLDAVKHIYMKDEVDDTGSDIIITDVGSKEAYDEEKGKRITQPYDYSSDLTKNVAWWKHFSNELKKVYPNCFLVGENFDGYGNRVSPYFQGLDSQFDFANYYHIPAKLLAYGASGYGQSEMEEVFTPARSDKTTVYTDGVPDSNFPGGKRGDFIDGAFTSNHDVMRAINQASGPITDAAGNTTAVECVTGTPDEIRKAKIHAAATILHPGISWIYYGDELGMSSNTNTHIDTYGNENSMDIWYRQPMMWMDNAIRPNYRSGEYYFSSDKYDSYNKQLFSKGLGVKSDNTSSNEMFAWYKDLCEIKNMYPAGSNVDYSASSGNVLAMHVTGNGPELMIYLSTGVQNGAEYLINPGAGFNKVKEVNVSGANPGYNLNGSCQLVVFKK